MDRERWQAYIVDRGRKVDIPGCTAATWWAAIVRAIKTRLPGRKEARPGKAKWED